MANTKKVRGSKVRESYKSVGKKKKVEDTVLEEELKLRQIKDKKLQVDADILEEKEEQELDKSMEMEDNISITVMILILVVCFVVGVVLGYLLYRLAIDNSNVMIIRFCSDLV